MTYIAIGKGAGCSLQAGGRRALPVAVVGAALTVLALRKRGKK
ncbi:MAG TPA: hypothetical protein VN812_06610 [Candidatus Acidoferrales bacterium]|nr:hypothetical protein [Candidatus Acidoferrales bacterium]